MTVAIAMVACGAEPDRTAPATTTDAGTHGDVSPSPQRSSSAQPSGVRDAVWREHPAPGLDFVHFNGRAGEDHLAEITCAGGALFDADNDGDLDVYLAQGDDVGPRKLAGAGIEQRTAERGGRLFRNEWVASDVDSGAGTSAGGALRFTDATDASGLADGLDPGVPAYGCAAAAGDFDNDGWTDLFVLHLGVNRLWRNLGPDDEGRLRFVDHTEAAGLAGDDDARSSVGAVWLDYDRDGWLDVFVANNLRFVYDDPPRCFSLTGAPDYCGPGAFAPEPDRLWRNRGDGTFEDATAAAGLDSSRGPALGVVAVDVDGDGWRDLYVANDGQPNHLWMNLGADGKSGERGQAEGAVRFEDRALLAGCAVNADGASEAGMGVAVADYDRDGDPDLFVAHLVRETNTLYRNDGHGLFEDHTRASGLGPPSVPFTGFGVAWLDVELDGWLDLLVVNGAVTKVPALVRDGDPFPLHQPNQLFRNRGRHGEGREIGDAVRFQVDERAAGVLARSEVSRGLLTGDLDNDGDVDAVVVNNGGPARVLENVASRTTATGTASWIGLRLVGDEQHPRDMLGAEVTLHIDGERGVRRAWVGTDGSYGASRDPRVVFGLGDARALPPDATLSVVVRWPDGHEESFKGLVPEQYHELRQGTGKRTPGKTS